MWAGTPKGPDGVPKAVPWGCRVGRKVKERCVVSGEQRAWWHDRRAGARTDG